MNCLAKKNKQHNNAVKNKAFNNRFLDFFLLLEGIGDLFLFAIVQIHLIITFKWKIIRRYKSQLLPPALKLKLFLIIFAVPRAFYLVCPVSGKRNENVLPLPTLLSTCTLPL